MLLDEPLRMPHLAFAHAWQADDLGPTHPVIGPATHWPATDDIAAHVNTAVRDTLTEPGWMHRGRITGEAHDLLLTVAQPRRECYGWIRTDTGERAVLVAVADTAAVKIVRDGDLLTLDELRPRHLIRAVLDELPDTAPAGTGEFSVPRSTYTQPLSPNGNGAGDTFALDTTSDYTATTPADQLAALMAAPRTGTHTLHAAARTAGTRHTSTPLTVIDTAEHGRILTYLCPGADDLDITCGPGTPSYLNSALTNTLHNLVD